jgi:5-methylcytosine-specific restriction endonuclease McrA
MSMAHREAISKGSRGKKHPPDCGHCAAIKGAGNGRWNEGSSQKDIRRRVLKYGGQFDPAVTRLAVMERDGWMCQICGEAILPTLVWMNNADREFGTIDHIIPISEKGDHTWDNVQAAHFWCNSERWYLARRERSKA